MTVPPSQAHIRPSKLNYGLCTLMTAVNVVTMCLGLLFFFYLLSLPLFPLLSYCTTDTLLSLLVIALSWTYLRYQGQDKMPCGLCTFPPYLLHALPSPLHCYLCMHQCLLMRTLCALFVPASPCS